MNIVYDQQFALSHLKKLIPSYENLNVEHTKIQRMTGITNLTFHFSHTQPNIEPKDVIFRVFGKTCEGTFINRNDETQVYLTVAEHNLGPKLYGYDEKVRAEQFLYSSVLKQSQMRQQLYRRQVAEVLSQFHQIKMDNIIQEPLMSQVYNDPTIMEAVLNKINQKDIFNEEELKQIEQMKNVWFNEEEKQEMLQKLSGFNDRIVFSHNDLLANNVLILDSDKSVSFIDFEYCHYNLRTYDISNYFNESRYDYSNPETPYYYVDNKEILREEYEDFMRVYLVCSELLKKGIKYDKFKLVEEEEYFNEMEKNVNSEKLDSDIKQMIEQEIPFTNCLSHFYWGIWALYMSKDPNIDFDYVQFAFERFQKYVESKKLIVN